VRERLDADGAVVIPLEEDDVIAGAEHFRARGIRDIAICFLHSYRNPQHEQRAAEILAAAYPEATVSASHQLVREWREYERTSTTAINAYIRPRTGEYIESALRSLAERGYGRQFLINQSSGGVVSSETAKSKPVTTLFSGPAGGVAASASVGSRSGFANVIAFDMGGTSTDVAVVWEGKPTLTADASIEGHPISVPAINIHSIGAGGGSLAWIDEVGALNVGPRSAGAEPGPACYGRGGTAPTVTDANLVLGRVAPRRFVPGGLALDLGAAAAAIERAVGGPLVLGTLEAADGIVEIVNLKMAMAVRAVTVQRGLDPKDFVLFAFGGAGAAHACWIARELGIPRVVVPVAPGQFSALGIALTDVRHDFVKTVLVRPEDLTPSILAEAFAAVVEEARQELANEGIQPENMVIARSVDARYSGQEYTIGVPLADGAIDDRALLELRSRFHMLHEQTYGHSSPGEPVEAVNVRVVAVGRLPEIELPELAAGGVDPPGHARVEVMQTCFDPADGYVDCEVWSRTELRATNILAGPAIVADIGATTVIPPGFSCTVDRRGQLVIVADA
jgi:N-methylhydantoinase A